MTKLALVAALFLSGCVALGWTFGPGFSQRDTTLFAAPPVVVQHGNDYVLSWTQGSSPFFFVPSYEVVDGKLVFALVATASSGSLAGRQRDMKIEGDENIRALQQGGAFWWAREPEPNGELVALTVVTE